MGLFTQGRYAAIASTAALVIALGGTSYAAVMVTGGDIQNNTVTTKDIKDKTLKLKDFSSGAKTGLKGATGPAGATGPSGATGASGLTGPVGPSQIFHTYNSATTSFTDIAPRTVVSLELPPGDYFVSTKVQVHRQAGFSGSTQVTCVLGNPNGPGDYGTAVMPGATEMTISTQIAFTAPIAVQVNLNCSGFFGSAASEKRMTAVRAGSVTVTPYPAVP
jgi:hypothetical protein